MNVGFSDGKVELESPAILSPPLSLQLQCGKLDWESGRWRGFQIPESRTPLSPSSSSLTGGRLSRSGTLTTDRSTGLLRTTRSRGPASCSATTPSHSTPLLATQNIFAITFPLIQVRSLVPFPQQEYHRRGLSDASNTTLQHT